MPRQNLANNDKDIMIFVAHVFRNLIITHLCMIATMFHGCYIKHEYLCIEKHFNQIPAMM